MIKNNYFKKIFNCVSVSLLLFILGYSLIQSVEFDSATTDEAIHIISGYLANNNNNFTIDPEHPFLAKRIYTLPLQIIQPYVNFQDKLFTSANDFFYDSWSETREAANNFLYNWGNDADIILFYSRITGIIFTILFAFIFWYVTKKNFSALAGFFALLLFVFCPNILAHARLANTDIWYTGAYFFVVWAYVNYLFKITNIKSQKLFNRLKFIILPGLMLGFALAVKFSSLTLPIILASLALTYYFFNNKKNKFWPYFWQKLFDFILMGLIGFVVVWASYNFSVEQVNQFAGKLPDLIAGNYNNVLIKLEFLIKFLKPAEYWKGIALTMGSALGSRPAYLMGQFSYGGWWYYFPIVFLIKTPIPVLVLFFSSIFYYIANYKKLTFKHSAILLSIFVFFGITLFSKLNLGVRHILPIYPFIFMLLGVFCADFLHQFRHYKYLIAIILTVLFVWYIASSIKIYPSYLSYFNEFIGGPKNGGNYLSDSNIDWGQDLRRLKQYLDDNKIYDKIKMEYFWTSTDGPTYYGINWQQLEQNNPNQKGYIAIGVSALANKEFSWLKNYEPITRIGNSVYLYKID